LAPIYATVAKPNSEITQEMASTASLCNSSKEGTEKGTTNCKKQDNFALNKR
jgi:hypothetical protein